MNTETITVAFVNPPKQQGWSGSLKTKDGRYISVKEDQLGQFQPGGTYTVLTETTHKNGKSFLNFRGFAPQAATVSGGGPATTLGPTPHHAPYGQAKPNGNDSRMIFITGVVGRAMGSGNFSIGDLTNLTLAASEAYAALDGGGDPRPEPPPHESDAPF